ncbi:hypothetical protein D3C85_1662380 [compost metagenome]
MRLQQVAAACILLLHGIEDVHGVHHAVGEGLLRGHAGFFRRLQRLARGGDPAQAGLRAIEGSARFAQDLAAHGFQFLFRAHQVGVAGGDPRTG